MQQIEIEFAEYKQIVTAYFQYNRVVGTSGGIAKLPPIGDDPLPAMYRAI